MHTEQFIEPDEPAQMLRIQSGCSAIQCRPPAEKLPPSFFHKLCPVYWRPRSIAMRLSPYFRIPVLAYKTFVMGVIAITLTACIEGENAFTSVSGGDTGGGFTGGGDTGGGDTGGGDSITILASAENAPNETASKAFDGNPSTKWLAFGDSAWIQYDFGNQTKAINIYNLTSANDASERDPRDWRLFGSNDGANWQTLDTRYDETFSARFQKKSYSFNNNTSYRIYRLDITSNRNPSSANSTQIAGIELLESNGGDAGGGDTGGSPNEVVFIIKQGTGRNDWNSIESPVVVEQGQTLIIMDLDSTTSHWLHSSGVGVCPHSNGVIEEGGFRCDISQDATLGLTDYNTFHAHLSNANFFVRIVPADPDTGGGDNGGNDTGPDGAALYAQYCAACHGPLEQSSKRNATLGRIKSGMQAPVMAFLETQLSDIQLQAIEAALFYEEPTGSVVNARTPYLDMAVSVRQTQIDEWIDQHRDNLSSTDRSYTRYVYITDEIYQNGNHKNLARVCVSKTINSVATKNLDIINPEDASQGYGIVFAIDLRDYFPDNPENKWAIIAGSRSRISLPVDAFTYNVHDFRRYGDITDHPQNDTNDNMVTLGIQGKDPAIRMAMENAITFGARYVEAYSYLAMDRNGNGHERRYWRSGDPVYATDTDTEDGYNRFKAQCFAKRDEERPMPTQNSIAAQELTWDDNGGTIPSLRGDGLPNHPDVCAGGSATGSEAWRSLPNGLMQFYLWGNGNQRINLAASTLIKDPLQRELKERQELGVGQCAFCHVGGVMRRPSDMAIAKENGLLTNRGVADFWSDQSEIDQFYESDQELFRNAILSIAESMSDDANLNSQLVDFKTVEPCYTISGYNL
jgi:hypothetical protein